MHGETRREAMPVMVERAAPWHRITMTPWRWFLAGVVLVEAAWLAVPPPQNFIEQWYSQFFYRMVAAVIVALQNALPISITAVVFVTAALASVAWLVHQVRALRQEGRSTWWLAPRALALAVQVFILYGLWFLVVWGAGYQRTPVTARWELNDAGLEAAESAQLQAELLAIIHANVDDGQNRARDAAVASIAQSMAQVLEGRGDGSVRVPRQVRSTIPGFFLTFSTAGMCVPTAIEPFVDGAYDDVSFVQVAAHELAHVAGYNRESEATLIGYLAGLSAEDTFSRYAVALGIYMDLISRIRDEEERKQAWEALPERAREDYRIGREIGERYRIKVPILQRAGYHIYDSYLKSQGVGDGMVNYSVGLKLFAGTWRKGIPNMSPEGESAVPQRGVEG